MQDEGKSKEQLIIELQALRERLAEAEKYIAEHRRNEASLTESEQRFKLLYERAPIAYQSLDENGNFVEVNQTWLEALGYAKEEVLGRNFADFLHPDWANHFKENFPRFKAAGEILGVEFEMVKKDGSHILVSFHGKIGRDRQGRFKQTHCIFQDVTEQRRQEERLLESEQRFRSLFENSPVAYQSLDIEGRYIDVNPELCNLLGYSPEELMGRSFGELWPENTRQTFFHKFDKFKQEHEINTELLLIAKDGREVSVIMAGRIQLNTEGNFVRTHCILTDITERKRTEDVLRESESLFRNIFLHHAAVKLIIDPDTGAIVDANHAAEDFYGWPIERLKAMNIKDINVLSPEEIQLEMEKANTLRRIHFELKHRMVDGSMRDVDVYSSGIQVKGKNLLHLIIHDITDRKKSEESRQVSENRLRIFIEHAPASLAMFDEQMCYLKASRRWLEDYNLGERDLTGLSHYEIFPEIPERWKTFHRRGLAGEVVRAEADRFERADGSVQWLRWEIRPWSNLAGDIAGIMIFTEDITERKLAEENLRETTCRLNLATASAKAGVWDWNLQTNEMIWNDRMFELYGLTRESFPGGIEAWEQGLHPNDSSRTIEQCRAAVNGQRDFDTKFRVRRPDGTVVHIKADGLLLRDEEGKPLRMIGMNIDITEREQVEERLRESEERLDIALRSAHMGVWSWDIVRDVRYFDNQVCLSLGIDPTTFTGTAEEFFQRVHPDDKEAMRKAMARTLSQGVFYEVEYRVIRPDRSLHYISTRGRLISDVSGRPLRIIGILWDVTERKSAEEAREKLQAQLSHAQKMESVGRLAGGVAHDSNNMLGVILGHAEMAMDQVDLTHPLQADLQEIRKAARRSADLTRQLLAFARKQTVSPKVLDINDTVSGMINMIRRLIGEDIDLAWLPDDDLWSVKVDPSQIDQILANLCVNARDAIGGIGKVTIETRSIVFDTSYCADHAGAVAGEYVLLAVSDNGCGMDEETQGRLFEPFFTTKGVGEGTGLGLATVYGIVKQNNGFINVYSEPGQGTTFKIYLPRHAARTEATTQKAVALPIDRGHGTILLVEDEPAILKMTTKMLERQGYTVLQAGTPGEAIRLAQAYPGKINLLMTDVVMPEMNGRDLAKNLLSLYPSVKRLFMSGYTANVIAHHGVLDEGVNFIQKPFSMHDLAAKLRQVLGEGSGE